MGIPLDSLPAIVQDLVRQQIGQEVQKRHRNKYHVAPADERRFNGRTYHSKAEMQYAKKLDAYLRAGLILDYIEQPRVWLGVPENTYVPDFLVIPADETPYYVDVKGVETAKFRKDKKLWAAYGRLELRIVKRGQVVETIKPEHKPKDHVEPTPLA